MAEINKHEIRSPELQEVMSEIPAGFLKWGLFLFFGIVIVLLGVSWFISSPDIVNVPITITTYNPPVPLIARSGGKVERFFVNNLENVSENQFITLIDNQTRWDDVKRLEVFMNDLGDSLNWGTIINRIIPPDNLSLGEMQNAWLKFVILFKSFQVYIEEAYIPLKLDLLDKQIARQEEYIIEMKNQELLSEEDLRLTYNSYRRDSDLFHRSNYSISVNELEQSKQALLQKQVSFSSLKSSVKNIEASILKLKENKLDLSIQYHKEINQFVSSLNEAFQLLGVALGQWKEKYLLQSPVNGKITFTSFWNQNQPINPGDILATIIPDNPKKIIIRARVPISGSGKVKQGQGVNIKLSGYPYMENGVLRGRISSLSLVPVQENYIADIELTNGMRTSFGLDLGFIDGMTGTADVITENRRLIYRFIKPLQSILRK